jgi:hypothetical protein
MGSLYEVPVPVTFIIISRPVFLTMRNVLDTSVEITERNNFSVTVSEKSCLLWGNVEKLVQSERPHMTI